MLALLVEINLTTTDYISLFSVLSGKESLQKEAVRVELRLESMFWGPLANEEARFCGTVEFASSPGR